MNNTIVTIIDAPCGAGKTSWAIQEMINNSNKSYVFCTPYLDEIKRVRRSTCQTTRMCNDYNCPCSQSSVVEPEHYSLDPEFNTGHKIDSFNALLKSGSNIAVTHQTFLNSTPETTEYITQGEYTLILDETMDIITDFNSYVNNSPFYMLHKKDIKELLIGKSLISIDNTNCGKISWVEGEPTGEKFTEVKHLADLDRLYMAKNTTILCVFPPEIFLDGCFKEIYVLTYMFEGSILKHYFDVFGIEYERKSIKQVNGSYCICEYDSEIDRAFRINCKQLINVITPETVVTGVKVAKLFNYKDSAFSKSWCESLDGRNSSIRNNTRNFIRRIANRTSNDVLWTTYKSAESLFCPDGCKQSFLSCNARATNNYSNRHTLAYLCNMYANPMITDWLSANGTSWNKDAYALSSLIQWIFRSAIRNGESIIIYIPSNRMRNILLNWLDI